MFNTTYTFITNGLWWDSLAFNHPRDTLAFKSNLKLSAKNKNYLLKVSIPLNAMNKLYSKPVNYLHKVIKLS